MAATLFTRAGKSHPYTTEVTMHGDYDQPESDNNVHLGLGSLCFAIDKIQENL